MAATLAMQHERLYLFGGSRPWDESLWTASDDRVRGGASVSHLTVTSPERAVFHGVLDTETLGGAGFASQRTKGELALDLSPYAGLSLALGGRGVNGSDDHRYTLTLKDTLPDSRPDGRDRAGLSWEFDFTVPRPGGDVFVPWSKFRATYRGRDVPDAKPLNLQSIKRVSLMMRSFFDEQKGEFELVVHAIAAEKADPHHEAAQDSPDLESDDEEEEDLRKPAPVTEHREQPSRRAWWKMLFCGLL